MVYFTGDIHGNPERVVSFAKENNLLVSDTIILLGDVGANYYRNDRDRLMKQYLCTVESTILCIHGNHEIRPSNIATYKQKHWNGGCVWYEEEYPNLLFAKDGEIYTIEGVKYIAIGGAYSVDKHRRILRNWGWWEDEQPDEEVKDFVEKQICTHEIDVVLSHTCPQKYVPVEMFIPGIDSSTVDSSTEDWLDKIDERVSCKVWLCGHWHTDKIIGKMHFLFGSWESSGDIL